MMLGTGRLPLPRAAAGTYEFVMLERSQRLEQVDGFLVRSELESMGGDHEFSDTPRRRHRTHIGLRVALARAHSAGCGEPPPRSRARTRAAVEMSSGKFKPKFSGDRAMLALQRQLADDPGLIPEPSFKGAPVIRPLLIRLCSVAALAAFVAWGVIRM